MLTGRLVRCITLTSLQSSQLVPADILLLSVQHEVEGRQRGYSYVDTRSLDGETNLKMRDPVRSCASIVRAPSDVLLLHGYLMCETPNPAVNKFEGVVKLIDGVDEQITLSNVILRGSIIRNTNGLVGLVVNTGHDTKVMQAAFVSGPSDDSDTETRSPLLGSFVSCS